MRCRLFPSFDLGASIARPWRAAATLALGLVLGGCNLVANIEEGEVWRPTEQPECVTVADCVAKVPECREPTACDAGLCVWKNTPEGVALKLQEEGDCARLVCTGSGGIKKVPSLFDVHDDGHDCTVDACEGTSPYHTFLPSIPCYTGPLGSAGTGICKAGEMACDAAGDPLGACEGQVLPALELCDTEKVDEDCDGAINEEGEACVCVPGAILPCYDGPPGTAGIGLCKGGSRTCLSTGLEYGPCAGQNLPKPETCLGGAADEDCDGQINEVGFGCTCGDGYVSEGEACDDGNADSMDACTTTCKPASCGDGFIQPVIGEACDDGNDDSTDACTILCKLPSCGDGFVQSNSGEACDDGNGDSTDDCTVLCQNAVCGDGITQPSLGEQCDDGNGDSHDECTTLCAPPTCGDGFVQTNLGEACDDGNDDSADGCTILCKFPSCGDGFVQTNLGEACDDGNGDSTDECTVLCESATCGDSIVQPVLGEACDDGNGDSDDGCTISCKLPVCGDGFVQSSLSEACDDGNTISTDACTAACKLAACGDGIPQWGESCDDGNTQDGDGCPATCRHPTVAVSAGNAHTCAAFSHGRMKCWGRNTYGGLGLGDQQDRGDNPSEMAHALPLLDLGTSVKAVAMTTGTFHTCALLGDASIKCWGLNVDGQLGLEDTISHGASSLQMGDNLPAVNLGTGRTAAAVAAGGTHTCALLDDHTVKCWGDTGFGQLGLGDALSRGAGPGTMGDNLPSVNLGTGRTAVAIAAGSSHTCALLDNASVKCWGRNSWGQLGLGDTVNRGKLPSQMGDGLPAVDLGTGRTAVAIAAASFRTCALLDDGSLKCWGDNFAGALGLGDFSRRGDGPGEMGDNLPAVNLGTGRTAAAIAMGDNFACARLDNDTVKCWGSNSDGQIGLGAYAVLGDGPNEMGDNLPFVDIGTGRTAVAITAGDNYACALLDDGALKCWGNNGFGQLGLEDTNRRGDGPGEMGDMLPAVKLW